LGNLLFAGSYLQQNRDFNQTIEAFSRFYEVPPDALLNVTMGENLFLVAEKEDGSLLLSEADIVAAQSSAKISDLVLIDERIYRSRIDRAPNPPAGGARWSAKRLALRGSIRPPPRPSPRPT